ncbi:unnamed protein product [Spirodela intermedia]|uniref:Uncharacterized protein n=1 Tax=Spirodela intermedia TaxID=51605 RepID=A0A7I8KW30_SPIIN|nr:unnamed protein product [Spirodela intermedia]
MWAISRSPCERLMKWVIESSLVAVTRQSGKTTTLQLSSGEWCTRALIDSSRSSLCS